MISIIVAMSRNRVIGINGELPWYLPKDLRRFKQLTLGQTLLMGRKTFESIGRPLPGRQTIILSRNSDYQAEGCRVAASLEAGLAAVQTEEVFICGGEQVYRQALPLAEKIYLTELQREITGDTFFPKLPPGQFQAVHSEEWTDDGCSCRFSILQRNQESTA